jgi:4-amino-4-deoxy-L-arabinose transferase-like glycosyltransferase
MWLWLVIVTAFFSLPQSKLIGYILPVTMPMAFLIADAASALRRTSSRGERLWGASAILATVCCLVLAAVAAVYPQRSARELAQTLQSKIAPGDRVIFLQQYYFDLPFYAGLRAPVQVADDWGSPDVARHDNWRKELADAAQFAPVADREVLLPRGAVSAAVCASSVTWLVAPRSAVNDYPDLQRGQKVFESKTDTLWRVSGGAGCPEKPSADSAHKS